MSLDLFVAGGHTDVGKTWAACALISEARRQGLTAAAFKPVASGFDPATAASSDPGRLLAALGRALTPEALDAVTPLRFAAPLAPPTAARREGVHLAHKDLLGRTRAWLAATPADLRLVEGAGGVMSPLAEDATNLDLIVELGLPTLLVGGAYLGAISHTLTAIEALKARGAPAAAVLVSEGAAHDGPGLADTVQAVRRFAQGARVFAAARDDGAWAVELLRELGGR